MPKVDNAIILAAGTASRFAPLSFEKPKSLFEVKGEVLIERQIRQLREAGINQIILVVGYKKECFEYLKAKYDVILVENNEFLTRNNNGSIFAARKYLSNSYICSSDNYFEKNPFSKEEECAYYSVLYSDGPTDEWCVSLDAAGFITDATIGGIASWYMFGHVFWDRAFSEKFISILQREYDNPITYNELWEEIFLQHTDELKMKIKRFAPGSIYEFDTLDELRDFDRTYLDDTRSAIIQKISKTLSCKERDIVCILPIKSSDTRSVGCSFEKDGRKYNFYYEDERLEEVVI